MRPIHRGRRARTQGVGINKNQVEGGLKEAAGKVQEKAGELVGSKNQQAKGLAKEVEGKAQKQVGNAEQTLKNDVRKP